MAAKKKEKLADYIVVDVSGVGPTRIMRGDMTDEEWADTVRRAQEDYEEDGRGESAPKVTQGVVESLEEADEVVQETPREETVEEVVNSNPDADDAAIATAMGVSPEHVAQVRAFIEKRKPKSKPAAEQADEVVTTTERSPVKQYSDAAKRANDAGDFEDALQFAKQARAVADYRPEYAEELRAADAEQEKALRYLGVGKSPESSEQSEGGGGTLGSKVRSMLAGAATKALPGGTEGPVDALPGGTEGPVDALPPMRGGEVPDPLRLTSEPPDTTPMPAPATADLEFGLGDLPIGPGMYSPNRAMRLAKDQAKQLGELFPQALPANAPPAAPPAAPPGSEKLTSEPGDMPPASFAPPGAVPGGSNMVSGSMKTTSPGMAPPTPSDGVLQTLADAEALRNGAATMAADAHAKKADIDRQALINQKALQEQAFKDQQHIAEQRAAAEAAYSKSLSDGQAAMSSLMAERRQLLNQRVDPDRYWNEAGAGRRVSAVLAGALYGWAGQGMDYLQHLRGLVNDDIKLQQDELRRKGDNIDALVGDQKNIIALAKQKGMTDLEAVEAAKAARYEELNAQLQMLATDSGIKNVNPALAQTLAGLANERATAIDNAAKFRQQKAHEDAQVRLGYAKLAQERREMAFRMAQGGSAGGPKTQEQKPQQQERLADYLKGAEGIASMWQDYKRLGGADSRMFPGSKGLSALNPAGQLGLTDAGLWDGDKATEYTQLIGKPIEGGVVREEDTKRYRKNYIPSSTDTEERAKEKTDTLINQFVKNYAIELRTQAAAGIDVSQYEPPDVLERRIREQTFPSRNQKPLPGETPRR